MLKIAILKISDKTFNIKMELAVVELSAFSEMSRWKARAIVAAIVRRIGIFVTNIVDVLGFTSISPKTLEAIVIRVR